MRLFYQATVLLQTQRAIEPISIEKFSTNVDSVGELLSYAHDLANAGIAMSTLEGIRLRYHVAGEPLFCNRSPGGSVWKRKT